MLYHVQDIVIDGAGWVKVIGWTAVFHQKRQRGKLSNIYRKSLSECKQPDSDIG
jgi:hypothetical protein